MRRGRLADPVVALLPAGGGRAAVAGRGSGGIAAALAAAGWTVAADGPVDAAVVSFLGTGADAAARGRTLAALRARLAPAGRLVVVDHNRPRRACGRAPAALALWARGLPASRAAYPTAREIAASGFVVERLRLAAGERVQLVVARPRDAAGVIRTR